MILVSTTQPTQADRNKVQNSKMPWVLYEMIPADQHEMFASLGDDLRKKFFPEPDPGLSKTSRPVEGNTTKRRQVVAAGRIRHWTARPSMASGSIASSAIT